MSAERLEQLFTRSDLDMTKLCPNTIEGHKLIKCDQKGQTGGIKRVDYKDGTFSEIENVSMDPETRTQVYKTVNQNRKCYQGVGEITETFTITPVTYANCLLM